MSYSFSNMSIKSKFLTFFIPLAIILLIAFTVSFYVISINQIENSEIILLKSRVDEFNDLMKFQEKNSMNLVSFIANMEGVKAAYSEPDNEIGFQKLQATIKPIVVKMNVDIKKFQLHFHKPPAISFWRIFNKKRNDDLSKFRKTILKTYETKKPVLGLEHGIFNFGIRAISPIINDKNEYVGSVEMITDLPEILTILNKDKEDSVQFMTVVNTEYLNKFISEQYMQQNYPKTIGNYKASKITDSKFEINSVLSEERINRILGTEQYEFEMIGHYIVGFVPIIDFNNDKPGLFVLFTDIEEHLTETTREIILMILAIIIAFTIIIVVFTYLINKIIINPITEAKQKILNLSEGKF